MKKQYNTPIIEIEKINDEDIIRTSEETPGTITGWNTDKTVNWWEL